MVWNAAVRALGMVLVFVTATVLVASCSSQPPSVATPGGAATPVASGTPSIGGTVAGTPTRTSAQPASPTPVAVTEPTKAPPAVTSTTAPSPTKAQPTATPTIAPSPTKAQPTATATKVAAKKKDRVVLGYYVNYDTSSWASLQANADAIDYVALQTISPDACGNIAAETDVTLLEFAHSRGIGVLPSVFTSSRWLNHRLLADEAATANFIQQLTSYVVEEGYDGLDVDLEDIEGSDRDALTAFIGRLAESLRKKGKLLTMAVPAKASDVTTGWAGAYEYAALAPHVDLFTIMSYAYTTSSTPPGSTAPAGWVDKVTDFATSQIPPGKVLVGVAFYGYDWNTTEGGRARALRYPQAAALAAKYGATIALDASSKSAKFSYSARAGDQPPAADEKLPTLNHVVKSRTRPACPVQPPTPAPRPTQTPKPTPPPDTVQEHVVWLEDAAAVEARLGLAEKHNAGGIGAWRLGQEDPRVWPTLKTWRR